MMKTSIIMSMMNIMTTRANKKIILRRALDDYNLYSKKDLVRIVLTKDGELVIDLEQKVNGRGAYLRKNTDAILLAKKRKLLNKAFKKDIPDEFYDEIIKKILERG